jgi:hypothetical protein
MELPGCLRDSVGRWWIRVRIARPEVSLGRAHSARCSTPLVCQPAPCANIAAPNKLVVVVVVAAGVRLTLR